jgi:hypothetical protein
MPEKVAPAPGAASSTIVIEADAPQEASPLDVERKLQIPPNSVGFGAGGGGCGCGCGGTRGVRRARGAVDGSAQAAANRSTSVIRDEMFM